MYSLLIKNALLVDGTGKPAEVFDVAVEGDKIVNIDRKIDMAAHTTIDAAGKVLAPGFVDIQNHSDSYWQLFDNPALDSLVSQGYTTVLIGNCGASLAPIVSPAGLLAIQKWHSVAGLNVNWQSFAEYMHELSKHRLACNVASLVGYSTIRRGVIGDKIRALSRDEREAIARILEESLQAGAFGMSSGLSYAHEINISELELFEMAKVLKKYEALFSVHLRSEGDTVIEALAEALDLSREAELNVKISHFKVRGQNNWDKFDEAVNSLETAYHHGANVHFDLYPYDTVWQPLYSYLPRWAKMGGRQAILSHLADPVQRKKTLSALHDSRVKFSELTIASTANRLNYTGKRLGQIAKNLEVTSEEAALYLIQNGGSEVLVFEKSLDALQVEELALHPLSFIATDGGGFKARASDKLIHPRCFGTAPRFIRAALDSKKMPLEKIVAKLSSGPAKKIGLQKRGEIAIGNFADLVIFDSASVSDRATYENPYVHSAGIDHVFVNGSPVVRAGKVLGQLPGRILRRK